MAKSSLRLLFDRSGKEGAESEEDLGAMPGIGMRTATIAVVERQPSLESHGGGGGGEGGEVVSTISGVIVKQVRERQDVGEERERN